ncbi:PREDICTED: rap1 GTPase-GDP dissociation stimulator 1-B-like [Priapulus caudatus]|uniref:Rap1 GTPase-GDP dissociation stimulator 1-B-like n=1 Tax=Priapulus caudatus TaxID=37621 RepID=A0ABM1F519_PRICU|nr:PREDICTED: rap1 GTPase-GDP dissociation stimulator 1-B-like [Priapulus caudatus]
MNEELCVWVAAIELNADSTTAADVDSYLDRILAALNDQGEEQCLTKSLVDAGILKQLSARLHQQGAHAVKSAEIIAEVAKLESARQTCVDADLARPLVEMLVKDEVAMATQACRALGNICYECDAARQAVFELHGTDRLVTLLRAQLHSREPGADKLRLIACGFLLNLTNAHGECARTPGGIYERESYVYDTFIQDGILNEAGQQPCRTDVALVHDPELQHTSPFGRASRHSAATIPDIPAVIATC